MHTAQWIYIGLVIAGLMVTSHQHGRPKTGKENVWTSVIAQAIVTAMLYWGGFFTH